MDNIYDEILTLFVNNRQIYEDFCYLFNRKDTRLRIFGRVERAYKNIKGDISIYKGTSFSYYTLTNEVILYFYNQGLIEDYDYAVFIIGKEYEHKLKPPSSKQEDKDQVKGIYSHFNQEQINAARTTALKWLSNPEFAAKAKACISRNALARLRPGECTIFTSFVASYVAYELFVAGEIDHNTYAVLVDGPPKPYAQEYFNSLLLTKEETSKVMKTDTKIIKVEAKIFVNGKDTSDMDDDMLFNLIHDAEQEIIRLDAIKAKPKKLQERMDELNAGIKALVDFMDSRSK